jgi:hypothetical protein
MSLLNEIYATPSRVKGVVHLLSRERGHRLKRQSAEELLSPESLLRSDDEGPGRAMVGAVINECVRLGLLREDGESLELSADLPAAARRYETIGRVLPGVILDRVLDPAADANQDLAAALAWFLSEDVLDAPGTWGEVNEALEGQGMKEVLRFNDNRYKMFVYWSRYLGLANLLATPVSSTTAEERLAPDPTECLRRIVAELPVRDGERLPAADFLQRVSARCPLFEGGAIRSVMDAGRKQEGRFLSSTTSHALLRLEEGGVLRLEMLSDADAVLLVDGPRPRPVSEMVRVRAAWEAA